MCVCVCVHVCVCVYVCVCVCVCVWHSCVGTLCVGFGDGVIINIIMDINCRIKVVIAVWESFVCVRMYKFVFVCV